MRRAFPCRIGSGAFSRRGRSAHLRRICRRCVAGALGGGRLSHHGRSRLRSSRLGSVFDVLEVRSLHLHDAVAHLLQSHLSFRRYCLVRHLEVLAAFAHGSIEGVGIAGPLRRLRRSCRILLVRLLLTSLVPIGHTARVMNLLRGRGVHRHGSCRSCRGRTSRCCIDRGRRCNLHLAGSRFHDASAIYRSTSAVSAPRAGFRCLSNCSIRSCIALKRLLPFRVRAITFRRKSFCRSSLINSMFLPIGGRCRHIGNVVGKFDVHRFAHGLAGKTRDRRLRGEQAFRCGAFHAERCFRGIVYKLRSVGNQSRSPRGSLTMDCRLIFSGSRRSRTCAQLYTFRELDHHRRARRVAIRAFRIRSSAVEYRGDDRERDHDNRYHREHVQHHAHRAGRLRCKANELEDRHKNHGAELCPFQDRDDPEESRREIAADTPAVVVRDNDHLAATPARIGRRRCRHVARNHVLTHAFAHEAGNQRNAKRLRSKEDA